MNDVHHCPNTFLIKKKDSKDLCLNNQEYKKKTIDYEYLS